MSALRVLGVGHGGIGRVRARAIVEHGAMRNVTLAGTVDPSPRDPSLYPSAPHFARFEEVSPADFDAAIVALPHDLAGPLTLRLLSQGKPVLVEKPLGITVAETDALVDAGSRSRLPCFVGYNYRFLPTFVAALAALRADHFGRLRSIDMLLGHGGHPGSAKEWKLDPQRAGGGVIIDPGVHLLDLLLLIEPRARPLLARGTTGFFKTGVEEDVVCVLASDSCTATVRLSHVRWVNDFRIEVVGEAGYAILTGRGGTYGPMSVRLGRRWTWNDGSGRSQRETEEVTDFGKNNQSFELELEAVFDAWQGRTAARGPVAPATFVEAQAVARLCAELYGMLEVGGSTPAELGQGDRS
jgi:1,5-anhydro-D-fructose reductase (1,5-anhydro-D-mannitol-forming)